MTARKDPQPENRGDIINANTLRKRNAPACIGKAFHPTG